MPAEAFYLDCLPCSGRSDRPALTHANSSFFAYRIDRPTLKNGGPRRWYRFFMNQATLKLIRSAACRVVRNSSSGSMAFGGLGIAFRIRMRASRLDRSASNRAIDHPKMEYSVPGYSFLPMRISVHSPAYKELRTQLTQARENANLTQASLAHAIGRNQSFVSKYESGERKLDALEFATVAAQLGVDPTKVLTAALACAKQFS